MFSRLLFDWAIGNADNHLKNHSFLWAADWSAKEVAPLYDITATTVYPQIDKEMGVSFGGSRRIDRVELDDVLAIAKSCGVSKAFAESEVEKLMQRFIPALHKSIDCICNQGFPAAEALGQFIEQGFKERSRYLHS